MSDVLTPVRTVRNVLPETLCSKPVQPLYRARNRAMLLGIVSVLILWLEYCCIMAAWDGWSDAYATSMYAARQPLLLLAGAIVLLAVAYWKCWIRACDHWNDWSESLSP